MNGLANGFLMMPVPGVTPPVHKHIHVDIFSLQDVLFAVGAGTQCGEVSVPPYFSAKT